MTESSPDRRDRPRYFRRHPGVALAVVVILIAIVLDFLGGLIFKTLIQARQIEETAHARKKQLVEHNPYYHHGLLPDKSVEDISWGNRKYSVFTNSLGFRDASLRKVDPVSAKCRILFIGDSFTFGVGVNYQESFVGIIQDRLASSDVDVLNAAGESYSPVVYYRRIEYLICKQGLNFQEAIVFLDIGDPQDEASFYRIDEKANLVSREARWLTQAQLEESRPRPAAAGIVDFVRDHTVLFRFLWIKMRLYFARPLTNLKRSLWTVDKKLYEEFGRVGLEKMKQSMDSLADLLEKHGIALTIAVYPWPDQILHRDLQSIQVRFWQEWAAKRGVRFFNLFPAFIGGQDPDIALRTYYIKGDVHWNEAGHKLVAEKFLGFYCHKSNCTAGCRPMGCEARQDYKR